uniref:Uncharacterized protein n=1 Tax=Anguilla anguilla TaxID=7936 RepID=A0A0E9SKE1_ANGAN
MNNSVHFPHPSKLGRIFTSKAHNCLDMTSTPLHNFGRTSL